MNRLVKRRFSIDQEHAPAAFAQQTCRLQACEARADDDYIISIHPPNLERQRSKLKSRLPMQKAVLVAYDEVRNEIAFVDK